MKEKTIDSGSSNSQDDDCQSMQSALEEAQRRYQQLIDDLPAGYAELDLEGNLINFNKALVSMYSRSPDELKGLSYKAFLNPKTAGGIREEFAGICETGLSKNVYTYEVIRKDGEKMIVEGSVTLKRVNGKVAGFRGFWRDITERRRTRQALIEHQHRLEAIFASVQEGIIALDADGRVISANRAIEVICGAAVDTFIGKPLAETQTLCDHACHALMQRSVSGMGEIRECRIECRRAGRPHQVVVFNTSPLMDAQGKSMGAVLVIRDITEMLGLEKELRDRYQFQNLIGKSKEMQAIYDLLETLASLETTVLITGESGTGKELVARALHYAGGRARRPFVKVNCSALSESLLESELFGHVQGAFTGAVKDRRGRFEIADGGTLLLDEIGEISPLIQLKLLRVLQEKEFERVGESMPRKVDVRVLAATNKDLKEKVKAGQFREDLYYRIKVMEISLPPLRERLEDLPLLIDHFCRLYRNRLKKSIKGVSGEVLNRFMAHAWPGNVRELEHALEHAFVLCSGRSIEMGDLPAEIRDETGPAPSLVPSQPAPTGPDAREVLQALEKCRWNKTKAALLLGIDRSTLHRRIKRYRLMEE